MAGITSFYTSKSIDKEIIWGKSSLGSGYAIKWEKKTTRTALKSPCAGKADADAKMSELTAYTNVSGISGSLAAGGMWEVTATITEEVWTNLGTYKDGAFYSL